MPIPIQLPDLGTAEPVRISCWLVEPGETVEEGDRVVEVLVRGMTFDVSSPAGGIVGRLLKAEGGAVETGEVLGWIEDRGKEVE